jgi:tRNA wybutosine-synthesizing protein 2
MPGNPLHNAIRSSFLELPPEHFTALEITIDSILTSTPKTFSIYEPLLLLPAHIFRSSQWTSLLDVLETRQKNAFFAHLGRSMKVTHIALNSPISLTSSSSYDSNEVPQENIQRRPNITPLHGDFGLFVSANPTTSDMNKALWVSTRQNGILQTWAPLYTMFSRGNITEKARLLSLPSVRSTAEEGCTAVDLYAGIGYFVFSYAKAGVGKVVGFEINGWSIEGLRRGAEENGWPVRVVEGEGVGWAEDGEKIVVFEMGNESAGGIIERARGRLPPVRHVNLGLLPTSNGAYATAVQCLDLELGGWLHVHENFEVKEIEIRAAAVVEEIGQLAVNLKGEGWRVNLEHVERVKTYAPGVMHCVLDIHVFASLSKDFT